MAHEKARPMIATNTFKDISISLSETAMVKGDIITGQKGDNIKYITTNKK